MARKKKCNITSVKYSYVGTDAQFDEFLKMIVHDYLAVDHPYNRQEPDFGASVESRTV